MTKQKKQQNHLIAQVKPILRRHHISKAALFGSFARGEQTRSSDVDILIDFRSRKTLLDLVRLQFDLQDSLKKTVDLVTYRSLHPRLKPFILRDAITIYEAKKA